MTRERDNQRQRVYDWEKSLGFYDGSKQMSFADCCKLIRSAWRMYAGDAPAPEIISKDWRSRSCYYGGEKHQIILNSRDNRAEASLHEVSHAIVSHKLKYLPYAPHGPEFVATYIMLLATFMGYDGATMRRKAINHGVLVARNVPFDMVNPDARIDVPAHREVSVPKSTPKPVVSMFEFRIGDKVKFSDNVKPSYMVGVSGVVLAHKQTRMTIKLDRPSGRFASGLVRALPEQLVRVDN